MTREHTDTFIILPPGAGRDRGLEQARAAREMGSRVIIIGEEGDAAAEAAADVYFPMPAGIPEYLTPFVYKLPFEYLACETARPAERGLPQLRQSEAARGQLPPDIQLGPGRRAEGRRLMQSLLAAIRAGRKPVIGMVQLDALATGAQYRGGGLQPVLDAALAEARILHENGVERADDPEPRRHPGRARGDARAGRLDDPDRLRHPRRVQPACRPQHARKRRGRHDGGGLGVRRRLHAHQDLCRRDDDAFRAGDRQSARGDQGAQRPRRRRRRRSSPMCTIAPARHWLRAVSSKMSSSPCDLAMPTAWCSRARATRNARFRACGQEQISQDADSRGRRGRPNRISRRLSVWRTARSSALR